MNDAPDIPFDIEAERKLIAACLFDSENYRAVQAVRPVSFYHHGHRVTWRAIQALFQRGEIATEETLFNELRATGKTEDAGGNEALRRMVVPSDNPAEMFCLGARSLARVVLETYVCRLFVRHAEKTAAAGYEMRLGAWEELAELRDEIEAAQALLKSGVFHGVTSPDATGKTAHLLGIPLSDVEVEDIHWLWHGRVALGKITVADGDPGLGKSLFTIDLAARVATGRDMPDGTPGPSFPAGVVLICGEDGLADTVKPRLLAAGASPAALAQVRAIDMIPETLSDGTISQRLLSLLADLPQLETTLTSMGARLLVIDPITAYLGNGIDMYRDSDLRRVLTPLAAMATRAGVAVVLVRHLNKNTSTSALHRGLGGVGFIGVARFGLLFAPNPDAEGEVLVSRHKGNVGQPPPTLAYRIVQMGEAENMPRISWLGTRETSAGTALAAQSGSGDDAESRSASEEAVAWLQERLAAGPDMAKTIHAEARADGLSEKALRTARLRTCVKPTKSGMEGGWKWELDLAKMSFPRGEGIFRGDNAATPEMNVAPPKMPTAEDGGHLRTTTLPKMPSESANGHLRESSESIWAEDPAEGVSAPKMPTAEERDIFDEQDRAADVLTMIDLQPGVGIGNTGHANQHIFESGRIAIQSDSALPVADAETTKSGAGVRRKQWSG